MFICCALISEEREIVCKTSVFRVVDKYPFILRIFKNWIYQGHHMHTKREIASCDFLSSVNSTQQQAEE